MSIAFTSSTKSRGLGYYSNCRDSSVGYSPWDKAFVGSREFEFSCDGASMYQAWYSSQSHWQRKEKWEKGRGFVSQDRSSDAKEADCGTGTNDRVVAIKQSEDL
jgi:hypothetical protein